MSLVKILKEIGEAKNHYPYRLHREDVDVDNDAVGSIYRFETDTEKYYVYLVKYDDRTSVDISFNTRDSDLDDFKKKKKKASVTGEGQALKVISTVVHIVKDFMDRHPQYKKFTFAPPFFDMMSKQKRVRIYKRFIKKAFPSARIKKLPMGNTHVVEL